MKIICIENASEGVTFRSDLKKEYFRPICLMLLLTMLVWTVGCLGNNVSPTPTSVPTQQVVKDIKWLSSLDEGRKEACKGKKILLLHFYATWGGWSKKMDKETYTYYKVIDLSDKFVCVKIDLDKNPNLEKSYGITGNPTVVFEDPFTKKEIKRLEGIRDRHEMTDEMTKILSYKVKSEGGGRNE